MSLTLRHIRLVMWNELVDALRSRRALVVLVLYVAMAMLTTNWAINLLEKLENEVGDLLQLDAGATTGAISTAIWKSERFRRMVAQGTGDASLVEDLIGTPPIALIYGALAFFYTPLLTVLVGSARIAEEVASGSARYALVRTSRSAWSTGKFLGQVALVGVALALSGMAAWGLAAFRMGVFEPGPTFAGMLLAAARAWAFTIPYAAMAVGVSHWTRSPSRATAAAMFVAIVWPFLAVMAERWYRPGWRELWHLVWMLTPQRSRLDLWRTDLQHLIPAVVHLTALAGTWLLASQLVFRRRDL